MTQLPIYGSRLAELMQRAAADPPRRVSIKAKRKITDRRKPVRCLETGARYPTAQNAASAIGLKSSSPIRQAVRTGGTAKELHWRFIDRDGNDVPPTGQIGPHERPVIVDGVLYPSSAKAAKAYGVHEYSVLRWIRQGYGYLTQKVKVERPGEQAVSVN